LHKTININKYQKSKRTIFEKYLKDNNIEYEQDEIYEDTGDKFDFKINDKIIDVKTGHLTWEIDKLQPGYRFFIAEHQLDKIKKIDCCINIQLDPEIKIGYIMGFILQKDLEKYGVENTEAMKGSALAVPLSDLIPIIFFKDYIFKELKKLEEWM
jgi:hypothetical protein